MRAQVRVYRPPTRNPTPSWDVALTGWVAGAAVILSERLAHTLFASWRWNPLTYEEKPVGLPGLEPGTSSLSEKRSNRLSYRP